MVFTQDISSTSLAMIATFCRLKDINICMYSNAVVLNGQYTARFLEKIYTKCDKKFVIKQKYDIYKKLKVELPHFWNQAAIAEKHIARMGA